MDEASTGWVGVGRVWVRFWADCCEKDLSTARPGESREERDEELGVVVGRWVPAFAGNAGREW